MKTFLAASICFAMALSASAACAGVVIDEQVTTGGGPVRTHHMFIQGRKEKVVGNHNTVVIDLDNGTMTILQPALKTYAQVPFPMRGMASAGPNGPLNMNFAKSGGKDTIAGYPCEKYSGAGKTAMAEVSTKVCFATSAPGADAYSAFNKAMAEKLRSVGAMAGTIPEGIPLKMESTQKIVTFAMPGMSADQQARLKAMLANRPPQVTNTIVTKVSSQDLPADTFAIPAGYTRRGAPIAPPSAPPASAATPISSPE